MKRLRDEPELFFCNKEASLAAGAAALPYGADTGPRCSDCAGGAGSISTLPRDPYFPFPPEKPQHFAFLACDAMVTSFHSPEKKGRKEKGPPARRKIPVARTPGRVRSPVGASCAATGIFLMAGVTKPLIRRAANTVRRPVSPSRSSVERPIQCAAGKMKKAAHTVRPAPAPGPLTLALAFLIHFDDCIKKNHSSAYTLHSLVCVHPVTCNRGSFTGATPPAHNCKNPKRASQKEADTTFPKCTYTHFSRLASSYMS